MLPIPISDETPTARAPVATIALIVLNTLAWFYELTQGVTLSVYDYGVIPTWLLHGVSQGRIALGDGLVAVLVQEVPWPLSVLSAMFTHASWMHIIGNMWFLWIFGDNLEDRMGPARYVVFYLLCGIIAAGVQIVSMPESHAPMVGASGAIAGVMGGYVLLYPHARVRCLWWIIVIVTTVRIPAWIWLGIWFGYQFLTPVGSGVAWMAHVGGFLAGMALVHLFVRREPPSQVVMVYPS